MWPDAAADDGPIERVDTESTAEPAVTSPGGSLFGSIVDPANAPELPDQPARAGEPVDVDASDEVNDAVPDDGFTDAVDDDDAEFGDGLDAEVSAPVDGTGTAELADDPVDVRVDEQVDVRIDEPTGERFDGSAGEPVEAQTGADGEAGIEPTGDPAVDGVLAGMADLDELAPADQVARYDAVHRQLHEILIGAGQETPSAPDDSGA